MKPPRRFSPGEQPADSRRQARRPSALRDLARPEDRRLGDGIRLLSEWGFFDPPEPRLARIRWMRRIEDLARTMRIYRFRLGTAGG